MVPRMRYFLDSTSSPTRCVLSTCGNVDGQDGAINAFPCDHTTGCMGTNPLRADNTTIGVDSCCKLNPGFAAVDGLLSKGCFALTCEVDNPLGATPAEKAYQCHDGTGEDGIADPSKVPAQLSSVNRLATGGSDGRTDELCCECPHGSFPIEGDVANGCSKFTCGNTDGHGSAFKCGANMMAQNSTAVLTFDLDIDLETCCMCDDTVDSNGAPLYAAWGGSVLDGCVELTCETHTALSEAFPCHDGTDTGAGGSTDASKSPAQ